MSGSVLRFRTLCFFDFLRVFCVGFNIVYIFLYILSNLIFFSVIFHVKSILEEHRCLKAFWVGNLKTKNLRGEEISSQVAICVEIMLIMLLMFQRSRMRSRSTATVLLEQKMMTLFPMLRLKTLPLTQLVDSMQMTLRQCCPLLSGKTFWTVTFGEGGVECVCLCETKCMK